MHKDSTSVLIIKWASSIIITLAMICHVFGIIPYNSYLQLLGATGWCYVAWQWNEKAILLNFIPQYFIIIPSLIYMGIHNV